jgi:hypothetical protein
MRERLKLRELMGSKFISRLLPSTTPQKTCTRSRPGRYLLKLTTMSRHDLLAAVEDQIRALPLSLLSPAIAPKFWLNLGSPTSLQAEELLRIGRQALIVLYFDFMESRTLPLGAYDVRILFWSVQYGTDPRVDYLPDRLCTTDVSSRPPAHQVAYGYCSFSANLRTGFLPLGRCSAPLAGALTLRRLV